MLGGERLSPLSKVWKEEKATDGVIEMLRIRYSILDSRPLTTLNRWEGGRIEHRASSIEYLNVKGVWNG
jgi:hypothetical protein